MLASGILVNLFPDWTDELFPLYALHPSKNLPPAKVRAFLDFIIEAVGFEVSASSHADAARSANHSEF